MATAARLVDEIGTSFGIPEMGQFSLDGEIRRRYWQEHASLAAWAGAYGIRTEEFGLVRFTLTDAVITGV